jgi:phosphatidylserine/phosphatidylglycerophosphate/cardiolipin synthase-like enzyme
MRLLDTPNQLPHHGRGLRVSDLQTRFAARLQLAQRAQASPDLQYHHFSGDRTGRALLRALRDAAARGVRVCVMIDDLYNHRMHNKLFIADGAWALLGGRNIADSYFLKLEADDFIDIDVLAAGAVLPAKHSQFERYWNAPTVYPLAGIVRLCDDGPDTGRDRTGGCPSSHAARGFLTQKGRVSGGAWAATCPWQRDSALPVRHMPRAHRCSGEIHAIQHSTPRRGSLSGRGGCRRRLRSTGHG